MALDGFKPWPPEYARRYRERGYWQDRTLGGVLTDAARTWPQRIALTDGERRWTYRELDAWADRLAEGLRARGIGQHDRVLVHLPNVAEFLPLCFALFRLGAIPVLALPQHRQSELRHLAELADPVACVTLPEHAALSGVEQVFVAGDPVVDGHIRLTHLETSGPGGRDDAEPADVAVLLLSGGTTGLPKLIPRTHADYHYNLRASADVCGINGDTRYLAALPMAHNFPLACPGVLGTLYRGGTVVLCTSADPETAFELIERERVTVTALVPPLATVWLEAASELEPDLSSLRLLQVGGSRLKAAAAQRITPELGCAVQQVYGMAEGLLNYTRSDDPDEIVFTSQGRPLSAGDEVRIVDENGQPVADGEVGELLTRGPYTIRGYFRAEQYNATAFTDDGFYRSGDLVRRLPSGHLVVEGRGKDVINRGGDKVPVEEVEELLLRHTAVRDVAIVGVPDPVLGERTCACVIPRGTAPTRSQLRGHLTAQGLAAFKLPDRVRIVDTFPRTAIGKVDRKALAAAPDDDPQRYPFNDFTGLDFADDYRTALSANGLTRVRMPYGEPAWLVTRHAEARQVLTDRRFSRAAAMSRDAPRAFARIPGGIVTMDPPDLTRIRSLAGQAFTALRVESLRPHVRELTANLIDRMIVAGPPSDLVTDFSLPIPIAVICELLGVPEADQERFRQWNDGLMSTGEPTPEESQRNLGAIAAYIGGLVASRRESPTDDLISAFIAARDVDDKLSEQELVLLCIAILVAGYEATAAQIPNFVHTLLTHDGQYARLAAEPEKVDSAVEELLRYIPLASCAMFAHYPTEDVRIGDALVKAGEPVMVSIGAANRDERAFADPDRLDLDRDPRGHMAFGHGLHHCIGSALGRLELQEALRALVTRLPGLRLAGEVRWKKDTFFRGPSSMPVAW